MFPPVQLTVPWPDRARVVGLLMDTGRVEWVRIAGSGPMGIDGRGMLEYADAVLTVHFTQAND